MTRRKQIYSNICNLLKRIRQVDSRVLSLSCSRNGRSYFASTYHHEYCIFQHFFTLVSSHTSKLFHVYTFDNKINIVAIIKARLNVD